MALKTIMFLGLFAFCAAGALVSPILGVLGYCAHYVIGPESQWWAAPVRPWGIRYSFILAATTAVGLALNWRKLRQGQKILTGQEKLLLAFLGIVWLSVLIGQQTVGRYTLAGVDHPSVKFTKVAVFLLMLTHIVTNIRNLDRLIWVLVIGTMFLGMQAWDLPRRAFVKGRLEGIGGPDFSESNFFAVYMATMLWLIGAKFLRSGWPGRIVCFIAGGFTANAVVLTRSRSAVIGLLAGGVVALVAAPKQYRKHIAAGIVLAGAGFFYLTDPQFLDRAVTIARPEEQRDASAESRVVLARAGLAMWKDHPLGVGPGNFYQNINRYVPEYVMKDVHNTYIRCLTELGIQGIIVFGLLIGNAFLILRRVTRQATTLPGEAGRHLVHSAFTLRCALATLLTGCLAVSLTYVEYTWWFLLLPVCLDRALENAKADAAGEALEAALTLPKEGPHQHRLPKRLPRRLPKPASAPAGT